MMENSEDLLKTTREQQNVDKNIKRPRRGCFSWIKAILIILLAIWFIRDYCLWGDINDKLEADSMKESYKIVQEIIEEEVFSSPETVKFPRAKSEFFMKNGYEEIDGVEYKLWLVDSYFYSESIFGTEMRTDYIIEVAIPVVGDSDAYYYDIIELD